MANDFLFTSESVDSKLRQVWCRIVGKPNHHIIASRHHRLGHKAAVTNRSNNQKAAQLWAHQCDTPSRRSTLTKVSHKIRMSNASDWRCR